MRPWPAKDDSPKGETSTSLAEGRRSLSWPASRRVLAGTFTSETVPVNKLRKE